MITDSGKRVGWVESFFGQIGLSELLEQQCFKIGRAYIYVLFFAI